MDSNFHAVFQKRKLIDIVDMEWQNDTLPNDDIIVPVNNQIKSTNNQIINNPTTIEENHFLTNNHSLVDNSVLQNHSIPFGNGNSQRQEEWNDLNLQIFIQEEEEQ
ncbi:hypothetical protein ABK040_001755 [Willaertia magna]